MRKFIVTAAAAMVLSGGALLASPAEAITLTAPAGVRSAIDQTSAVQQVRHSCYRQWRRGHWRWKCPSHGPYHVGRYYYGYPYHHYGYYPYYHRPYAYHRRPGVTLQFRF